MARQCRFALEADAVRRVRALARGDPVRAQAGQHFAAFGLERIHPQVERRALHQAGGQRLQGLGLVLRRQRCFQPVGQVVAHGGGQRRTVDALGASQPFGLAVTQHRLEFTQVDPLPAEQRRQHQRARFGARTATGQQRALAAQYGVDGFGDEGTVGTAHLAMLAEVARDDRIGRRIKTQELAEQGLGVAEKGGRKTLHVDYSGLIKISVATCTRLSPCGSRWRILTGSIR